MEKSLKNTDALLGTAIQVAREAGQMLRRHSKAVLSSVGKDTKLEADIASHTLILRALEATGIPVLSEEDREHTSLAETEWVVDPLDGSLNYERGIPASVVSLALTEHGVPTLGVVYDFLHDELYSGVVGKGAWLNGAAIQVAHPREKNHAVIMTGFPSYADYGTEALSAYIRRVQEFKKVRLIGSAALSLAYVASGRADVYFERSIKFWDVAAGLALVHAAGGVSTYTNVDEQYGYEVVAASTPHLLIV